MSQKQYEKTKSKPMNMEDLEKFLRDVKPYIEVNGFPHEELVARCEQAIKYVHRRLAVHRRRQFEYKLRADEQRNLHK